MALIGESGLAGNLRNRRPDLKQQGFRFFDSLRYYVLVGQTFCLLLTLLTVPVFYSIWDDFGRHPFFGKLEARWRLFKRNFKRRFRLASAARVKSSTGEV